MLSEKFNQLILEAQKLIIVKLRTWRKLESKPTISLRLDTILLLRYDLPIRHRFKDYWNIAWNKLLR